MLKIQPLKTSPKTLHKSQQSLFHVYALSPFLSFPVTRRCSRFLRPPSSVVRLAKRGELRRPLNSDFCKSPNPNPCSWKTLDPCSLDRFRVGILPISHFSVCKISHSCENLEFFCKIQIQCFFEKKKSQKFELFYKSSMQYLF
jgi:hypothetical protein